MVNKKKSKELNIKQKNSSQPTKIKKKEPLLTVNWYKTFFVVIILIAIVMAVYFTIKDKEDDDLPIFPSNDPTTMGPNGPSTMGPYDPNGPSTMGPYDPSTMGPYDPNGPTTMGPYDPNGPTTMGPYDPNGPTTMGPYDPDGPSTMGPYDPDGPTTMGPDGPTTMSPYGPTTMGPDGPTTMSPYGPTTMGPDGMTTMGPDGMTTMGPDGPTTMGPDGPTTMSPDGPTTMEPDGPTTMSPYGPTTMGPDGPTTMSPEETTTVDPSNNDLYKPSILTPNFTIENPFEPFQQEIKIKYYQKVSLNISSVPEGVTIETSGSFNESTLITTFQIYGKMFNKSIGTYHKDSDIVFDIMFENNLSSGPNKISIEMIERSKYNISFLIIEWTLFGVFLICSIVGLIKWQSSNQSLANVTNSLEVRQRSSSLNVEPGSKQIHNLKSVNNNSPKLRKLTEGINAVISCGTISILISLLFFCLSTVYTMKIMGLTGIGICFVSIILWILLCVELKKKEKTQIKNKNMKNLIMNQGNVFSNSTSGSHTTFENPIYANKTTRLGCGNKQQKFQN